MKQIVFGLLLFALVHPSAAQKGSAELMSGHRYLHYLHSFGQPVAPQSRFGWQHIATLIKQYRPVKEKTGSADELMNQAYLTYSFSKWMTVKGGLFYTNAGGYKPSLGVQALFMHKHGSIVVAPRVDVAKKQAYELFVFAEHFVPAAKAAKLVIRFQAMSNASPQRHNRSYQFIRLGIDTNNLQFGVGLTLDEFGSDNRVHCNAGIFIRKKW